jgi:hypothetical protein
MIKTARGSTTSVKATMAKRTANTFLTFAPRAVIEMIIFTEYRSEVGSSLHRRADPKEPGGPLVRSLRRGWKPLRHTDPIHDRRRLGGRDDPRGVYRFLRNDGREHAYGNNADRSAFDR